MVDGGYWLVAEVMFYLTTFIAWLIIQPLNIVETLLDLWHFASMPTCFGLALFKNLLSLIQLTFTSHISLSWDDHRYGLQRKH
jgi:hypothetical protein